jgi:tetratricopeptide (TPR) repeat protein
VALEVCQRQNTKAVLESSIASLGRHYVVTLHAVNCQTGESLAREQAEAASKEEVLGALGSIATRLRKKLGESMSSIQRSDTPIEDATTSSLEALRAYTLARKLAQKSDADALPYLKRAIELDPQFAAAHAALAVSRLNLGHSAEAKVHITRAFDLRDRVSEREKFRIATAYYGVATGELEKEVQTYEQWARDYPRDFVPHANLAVAHAFRGWHEQAIAEAREAMRLSPDHALLYANLSRFYIFRNSLEEAQTTIEEALARKLEHPLLHLNLYYLAFLRHDGPGMQQQAAWGAGQPGAESFLLSAQADTEAFYGRLEKARELSRRAVASALRSENREAAALWQAHAAFREAELGKPAPAREAAAAALALAPGRDIKVVAAMVLARNGETAQAEALADELEKDYPLHTVLHTYWLPSIRAAAELSRGHATRALELLRTAAPYQLAQAPPAQVRGAMYPVYLRGQAYLLAGRGPEAAAEFGAILEQPGLVLNSPLGALAHQGLARAYAAAGDRDKAQRAYETFLAMWREAEPDLPLLQESKAEHAKLAARRKSRHRGE